MATRPSDAQILQAERLTLAHKQQANREAAKIAALVAIYYQRYVNPEDPSSVDRWLEIMIPRLIRASDSGAERARVYFDTLRRLEVGVNAPTYRAEAATGVIDAGVRKSLLTVGPYDYINKARESTFDNVDERAVAAEIKQITAKKVVAATIRHAQAGGRETIMRNSVEDRAALGWVRVTRADPCFFCAMIASRGLEYRAFKENSFDESDLRFTGPGNAKVHDRCGCSLKCVYRQDDPLVEKTKVFSDMWSRWGAGGGDAAKRFRRGYEHWQETGEFLPYDDVAA